MMIKHCDKVRVIFYLVIILPGLLAIRLNGQPINPSKQNLKAEWVVYTSELGWLRIGSRDEFSARWQKKDEIWGGTSAEPLQKNLILEGFLSREQAVEALCGKLTKVQLRIAPPASGAPTRYISARYDDLEFNLRLTEGFDSTSVMAMSKGAFFKGLEYDWESEWAVLQKQNITPRYIFPNKQWLLHAIGRGTTEGPEKLDQWMCFTLKPDEKGLFTIPLEDGTTQTYQSDQQEGPFLDSYTFARVMKKYRLTRIDLWPPVTSIIGRDVQPRVDAEMIPDNPKDYGDAVLPWQPLLPRKDLQDWVVYATDGDWLHVGTRYEFNKPMMQREVIWGGTSEDVAQKTLLAPATGKVYYSYQQALTDLCANLTQVTTQYHPLAQPRETINGTYQGKVYKLRLERGANGGEVLEFRTLNYDYFANWQILAERKITPRRTFSPGKLVHATGHGTYSGPVKDDMWLFVPAGAVHPDGQGMTLPDGMGGTFGYSIDFASQEVQSNYELSPVLRQLVSGNSELKSKINSIGIPNEDRGVRSDEVPPNPRDAGTRPGISQITVIAVRPNRANQGDQLGVTILASGIDYGCRLDFGENIEVTDLCYGGRDADTDYDQWWCTLNISNSAAKGKRRVTATNVDGGTGSLADGFEISKPVGDFCTRMKLIVPAQAPITVPGVTKQLGTEPISVRSELQSLAEGREQKWQLLRGVLEELVVIEKSQTDQSKLESLWKQRLALEKDIRAIENQFAQLLARCPHVISENEYAQMRGSLRDRIECLSDSRGAALDAAREVNVFYKYSEYTLKARAYHSILDDFTHALQWWQHLSGLRLLKLQEQIKAERFAMIRDKGIIDAVKLRPLQHKLRDTYLDMGRVALLYSQANLEDVLFQQDTYLAAWREVSKQSQNIEEANTLKQRTAQKIIFGLKYLHSATLGVALGSTIDVGKRFVNSVFSALELTEPFANTVSGDITAKIADARTKTKTALKAVEKAAALSDEETQQLDDPDFAATQDLQPLLDDRLFVEQTSGGLPRLSACYAVTTSGMMDSEFSIAIQHARLNARDMRTTLNLAEGATPSGEYERWKRALTNPIGTVTTFMQNAIFDQFSTSESWVANRETEVRQMTDLQTLFRKIDYQPDIESLLGFIYPKTFQIHNDLLQSNPDYLQFLMEYRRIAAQDRLEAILREYITKSLPMERDYWEEMIRKNFRYVAAQNARDVASVLQFQGLDRMVVWDFDGALESFYQAYEIDPKRFTFAKLEELRQDFAWQKTITAGTETAVQLGNVGMHTALFAWLGNSFGEFFGVPPAPSLLQTYQAGELTAAQFVSGFADFCWMQVNPFAGLSKAIIFQQQWDDIAKALGESKWLVEQSVLAQDIVGGAFLWLGADKEYADLIGNALVNSGFHRLANQNSVVKEAITKLKELEVRFTPTSVDVIVWNRRQAARQSLFDELGLLKSMRELDEQYRLLRKEPGGSRDLSAISSRIGQLKNLLLNKLTPVTEAELRERYNLFEQRLSQIESGPEAMTKRLRLIADFLIENPLERIEPLIKSSNPKGQFYQELCQQIDQLRLLMVSAVENQFLVDHPEFVPYFEAYIHNGSWAAPDLPGYKFLISDLDLNMLVKRDTPASKRSEIKNAFDNYFRRQTGMLPEAIKLTSFVDVEPTFRATGEDVMAFLQNIINPESCARMQREINENNDALLRNLGEGERYLLRGSLFYLQFMNKFCKVKRLQNGQLVTDRNGAQIYANMRFAPWMGFDLVVGQLPFINQARKTYQNENVTYMKHLDKYAMRALLGMIIQSPRGLHELHQVTSDFVQQAGGPEFALIRLVEKIGRQPDPLRAPETAISEQAALQAGLREIGLSPEHAVLLKEWVARKAGKPLQEMFEGRANGKINDANDPRLSGFSSRHILETEGLIRLIVERTILGQASFLKHLENAFKSETSPERQQVIKDKMIEILYAQAAVWKQLTREQQTWIIKNSPSESDYWLVIAELERIRAASGQSNWEMLLRTWQPRIFMQDETERNRLKEEYQRQAQTQQAADLLETKLDQAIF